MPAGGGPHADAGGPAPCAPSCRCALAALCSLRRAPAPALTPELSPENRIGVTVDRALCIGSGDCVDTAPDVFQLDDEDKAIVVDPDGAPVDDIIAAAGNCPVTRDLRGGRGGRPLPVGAGAPASGVPGRAARERRLDRVGGQVLERPQEPAGDGQRLAILVAVSTRPRRATRRTWRGVQVGAQASWAHHDRAGAAGELAQLVGQRGQLAELDHVVGARAPRCGTARRCARRTRRCADAAIRPRGGRRPRGRPARPRGRS